MRKDIESFWDSFIRDIPTNVYVGLLLIFVFGSVLTLLIKGFREGGKITVGLFLIEYISLLLCSTVVFRNLMAVRKYNFMPFWSYRAFFRGEDSQLLVENIMNVVVFIPVGVLLGTTFRGMAWMNALGVGFVISISIELLQLILKRGFCELDDVMHNTLGCVLGYGLYYGISKMYKKR